MTELETPTRQLFRHMPTSEVAIFYTIALAACLIFGYGLWLRVRKYRAGRKGPEKLMPSLKQIRQAMASIAKHSTLRKRNSFVGFAHMIMFWGFAALFTATALITIDHDVLAPISPNLRFWKGDFYLGFLLILDVLAAGFVIGVALLLGHRYLVKPERLDYTRRDLKPEAYDRTGYKRDDMLFAWGLLIIGLTGFLLEILRILADRPPHEVWAVVSWHLANAFEWLGATPADANAFYPYAWWFHAILVFSFIAYIPYSKAVHMFVAGVNLALKDPLAGKRLPALDPEAASSGYTSITDLTARELISVDSCTKCGRCHAACPAGAGGFPLSPRDVILSLKEQADAKFGGANLLHETRPEPADENTKLIEAKTLYSCTTCLACVETCPVGVEHVPLIVKMRRSLVEEGTMETNLQKVLERIAVTGNSFGQPEDERGSWTASLPFKVKDATQEPVDVLWFVGDYASFDAGLQEITRKVATILHRAGVNFGILYAAERNSGNDVRRVGEEGLYQMLAEMNIAALAQAQFKEIITTDPHSYNTLVNEYPEFGGTYKVRHHTELIWELIESGALPVANHLSGAATYHDPCHLARYVGVTDAPRAILGAVGVELREMPRNRENTFCCGAGGGRIWMTDTGDKDRPSVQRIHEALEIPGLQYFVVTCPKDLAMYRDAAKTVGNERLKVTDLVELVDAATVTSDAPAIQTAQLI